MTDDPGTDRSEDDAGWAVPGLSPREPQTPTAPAPAAPPVAPPPPGVPPPPPGVPPPPGATASSAAAAPWSPTPPPSATPPRKRRGWIVALALALGGIVLIAVAGTVLFVDRSLPPFSAANDFIDDLRLNRPGAAAAQLCSADRDDPQEALSTVTRHFVGRDTVAVNPLSVDRDDDRATVEYTVSTEASTSTGTTYELPLREEGGEWRPCPGDSLR